MIDVVDDVSGRFAEKRGETGEERIFVVFDVVNCWSSSGGQTVAAA